MQRTLAFAALAALLAGCAQTGGQRAQDAVAPAPPPPPPPPPPLSPPPASEMAVTGSRAVTCPLTITFASYGAGIDAPTRERVQSLLVSDRRVAGFDTARWGREGEVTLCVRTRAAPDAAALFAQVRAMVPPRPRGPISLSTRGGQRYDTPAPPR